MSSICPAPKSAVCTVGVAVMLVSAMLVGHAVAADRPEAVVAEASAEAAEMALAEAEVAVAHARAEKALWTTAFDALLEARASRNRGDVASTLAWSARARELCDLSIGQLAYPPEKQ